MLPVDDIGLQRAIALHYNGGERMPPAEMRELALVWQPYRSVATWYLWRSLDPIPVDILIRRALSPPVQWTASIPLIRTRS